MSRCLACGAEPQQGQPSVCMRCFIVVPLPEIRGEDSEYVRWVSNCERVATQIVKRSPESERVLLEIGMSHLSTPDVAAALTAVAMEKLHLLSMEYNWEEGRYMVGVGSTIAEMVGDEWLKLVCSIRRSWFEIRAGYLGQATATLRSLDIQYLGEDLKQEAEPSVMIKVFTNLQARVYLALALALRGERDDVEQLKNAIFHLWKLMQPSITRIIVGGEQRSFAVGATDSTYGQPRLDKLALSQAVLVHEAIASSREHFSDEVFERLLVLGRMVIILGEMSPGDDPGFYGAILREYFLLFNGVLWFQDAPRENDLDLVQRTILQGHAIAIQWSKLLSASSWMQIRPSRMLEIFYRSMRWAGRLDPQPFLKNWMAGADETFLQYIQYVNAEALVRSGREKEGGDVLLALLEDEGLADWLRTAATSLLQHALLLGDGIVLDVPYDRRIDVLQVFIEVPTGRGNLTWSKIKMPVTSTGVHLPPSDSVLAVLLQDASQFMPRGIAVRGEVMEDLIYRTPNIAHQHLNQTIIVAGTSYFKDVHWMTPFASVDKPINGVRSDVLLLRIARGGEVTSLLFEADHIEVIEQEDHLYLSTPGLYHLVGVDSQLSPEGVLEILVDVLQGMEGTDQLDIYTLALLL